MDLKSCGPIMAALLLPKAEQDSGDRADVLHICLRILFQRPLVAAGLPNL